MADGDLLTIGQLARATGIAVKTLRFWSDEGLVPPADRTPAGYRLYGHDAQLRLALVRSLRDLDVDLATIRAVLDRDAALADVARTHAAALEVQIRTMRLQRSVLHAIADRDTAAPQEVALMHSLAQLSAAQRRRLITEFLEDTFSDLDLGPDFMSQMRAAMPELPEDPSQQQLDAWIELGQLVQDEDFRASLRRAAQEQARAIGEVGQPSPESHRDMAVLLQQRAGQALADGIPPESPQAEPIVDELVAAYARHTGRSDGPEFRAWLLHLFDSSGDERYERYWQLLAVINDWPQQPSTTPAAGWLAEALRAR
ncbi:helix-turn-helix domain-containing protein [Bounagaea algeriensis]